jgi:hypothetical protein
MLKFQQHQSDSFLQSHKYTVHVRTQAEAEEVASRSRGHGDGESEALPGEPVHHRGEREAAGEGQRAPPREPRAAQEPVQDAGRARGRSGSWSCVRLLPLAAC